MDAKKLKAAVKEVSAGEARGRGSSWSALIDRQLSVSGRFTAEGAAGSRPHAQRGRVGPDRGRCVRRAGDEVGGARTGSSRVASPATCSCNSAA